MSTRDRTQPWLPTPAEGDEYLGRYRVIRRVGSGGMGVVYLGADPAEQAVALKVLREHVAHDDAARTRLQRELTTLQRVRHRCVAGVIDADLAHHRPFIVTEFIDGPQLDDYIDRGGPLARGGLVTLGRGLLGALRAIHEVGVVHRDLKPGNVLLHDYRPVVIDFGIAQHADDIRLTMTGLFVGTPGYVAPEVIAGERATTATDWWGWAAVLVFAATGRSPAGTGPIEVVLDRIRRGELRLSEVDDDLRPLLADCLRTDPAARPRQREIAERFTAYADGGSTAVTRRMAARYQAAGMAAAVDSPVAHRDAPTAAGDPPVLASERRPTAVLPARPTDATNRPMDQAADQAPQPAADRRAVRAAGKDAGRALDAGVHRDPPPKRKARRARAGRARSQRVDAARASHPGRRTGMLGALGLLLVVLGASLPVATVGALLVLLSMARLVDRFSTGLQTRSAYAGPRRRNLAIELALSPFHAGMSVLLAAATLVVPLALAWLTITVLEALDGQLAVPPASVGNVTMGAATVVALTALYWGPGGSSTRRAARRSAQLVAPGRLGAVTLTALFVLGAALFTVLMIAFPSVSWWPLTEPLWP